MNKHWNDDDFLNRLYEVGPEDGHLEECASCRAQWEHWNAKRKQMLEPPVVQDDLMAGQRQRIDRRIAVRPSGSRYVKWSPALAVAGMVLFALLWKSPHTNPKTESDAQLMAEIYQKVYGSEPDAVTPIHALFETKPLFKTTQ